ncbi:MAG: DsrE/DsrF/DrsH-like family protein, partial [Candidatus Delongbacteria bacterium]|nr:DsrE/DsrF/DrsH-like family protein [Candidatus Delongbacteria bacterium]
GLRGYLACRILVQHGFTSAVNLSGGYKTYQHVTQKQSNEDIFAGDVIAKDDQIYQGPVEPARPNSPLTRLDACGLQCPGPILRLKDAIDQLHPGDHLEVTAGDPGFYSDVEAWCKTTGHRLVDRRQEKGRIIARIEKLSPITEGSTAGPKNQTSLIVFSDDLDRALASFVIANGAASIGHSVTLFFTFWGLNVIRRQPVQPVVKDWMGRMFGRMMPRGADQLKLSKMNMMGLGSRMMKHRMKTKQVFSLQTMMREAREKGVRMVACRMSMDIMGVTPAELMEGVELGGVATYLSEAGQSKINLVF